MMGKSDFLFMAAALVVFGLFFGAVVTGVTALDEARCDAVATKMGVEHAYSFWTGCMVKYPGGWVALDQVRAVEKVFR